MSKIIVCGLCGAIIIDIELHLKFHDELSKDLEMLVTLRGKGK